MGTIVKATYSNGILTPVRPLELSECCEVEIELSEPANEEGSVPRDSGKPVKSSEGLSDLLAWVKEQHHLAPPDAWDNVPTDLARNEKHYLYGAPKDEDE